MRNYYLKELIVAMLIFVVSFSNLSYGANGSFENLKLVLQDEPETTISNNKEVDISFTLKNVNPNDLSISQAVIRIENVTSDQSVLPTNPAISDFTIQANSTHLISGLQIISSNKYSQLSAGAYVVKLEYRLGDVIYTLPLSFFRKFNPTQIDTYEIGKNDYQGLPVYTLKGGMSAEYAVQKSLAALNSGVSHTWDVRRKLDGTLDLPGGGPVSVYSSLNFLEKSIKKTVDLYNAELGSETDFNTVIISTGVPSAPYLSYYMGAPILPLHFLVSVNSFAEVQSIVHSGIKDGYSCYATAGYDPSIKGEGVAWIKLLDLPNEYKKFILDHNVRNVIIMGATESGFGETQARRISFKFPVSSPTMYNQGSIYVMTHGGDQGLSYLRNYFKDYDLQTMEPQRSISDWESGITKTQIENFKQSIEYNNSSIYIYAIEGSESIGFYNITMDLSLKFAQKNISKLGTSPIEGIAMNEYLIGYPAYETQKGQIPMLYWQELGNEKNTAARVKNLLSYKISQVYPSRDFNAIPVKFNAKRNRKSFVKELKSIGMKNVTQNTWQKADVWNTSDGMEAPCELVAKDIIANFGGASGFKNYHSNLQKLTIEDLKNMAINDDGSSLDSHPEPVVTTNVASIPEAGLEIKRYEYPANPYWNSREQLKEIAIYDYNSYNSQPTFLGWLDGYSKTGNDRKQRITISQFDLGNSSDEYELKVSYKFHPKEEDGFQSYDPANGDEQNMDCFEYTKVPKTSWLDIPSRVMAREGAMWVVNGSVYDWDYNGVPGVVPFIKKDGQIKAQPQILSYKGEGAFAWNWGAQKSATIISRPKEISGTNTVAELGSLFNNETSQYTNALAGMTYMKDGEAYNIYGLQPSWMLYYPGFSPKHMGPSGTAIRCFLSNPNPQACNEVLRRAWGTVEYAPAEEGWNDCSRLTENEFIKRFSTLAYRQYDKLFERVPNARTYVAIKDNKLDVGIIDGDLGNFADARGVNYSKTFGMKNSEVSNYYQYKGYDKLINLDGGSSSQIWFNAKGPLHDWTGYPLVQDNQGPYYSRLVSSFLMLVPKKHTEEISQYRSINDQYLVLDNSKLTFNYNDNTDHTLDKAFISLSPSMPLLNDSEGMIAGNFKIENLKAAKGAVLFYQGEDTYYEDTEGESTVVPTLRNMLLIGIGKIPNYALKRIKKKPLLPEVGDAEELSQLLTLNDQAFYFIKIADGKVVQYKFEDVSSFDKYIDNRWHSFLVYNGPNPDHTQTYVTLTKVDNIDIEGKGTYSPPVYDLDLRKDLFEMDVTTHMAIGTANIDGRFVTGNAKLAVDNYLFVNGNIALQNLLSDIHTISSTLTTETNLPDLGNKYYATNTYALQFEESSGMHSFSLSENSNNTYLYGLNLNTIRLKNLKDLPSFALAPGNYYMVDQANRCLAQNAKGNFEWQLYRDGNDISNWDVCSKVSVTDEGGTGYERSFKLKDRPEFIGIDTANSTVLEIPQSNGKQASNYPLIAGQSKVVLKPYQLGNDPSTTTPVALLEDGRGSFSYSFFDVGTVNPSAASGASSLSSSLSPAKIAGIAIGATIGTSLVVGGGSFATYRYFNNLSTRGYNKIENIEMKEKCD
ncbi:hypothetical protein JL193_10060 [Polaribacter batillariae]|uniref:Uncharacterized protein n=1 Tax=Polaribacter batillariae TaxID=2808900 RepID=A0ABX7SUI1_9FLAO|nr:hypothetical protein [Polaribacter batillariae]QTD36493.1 hypothetical protein JL193_10060 [Polaribacter batillariae]